MKIEITCRRCGEVLLRDEVDLSKAPLDPNLATQCLGVEPHSCKQRKLKKSG